MKTFAFVCYECPRVLHVFALALGTWGSADPGQTQHAVVKVPVGENVSQAVVVVVLLRVQLQELLHSDVGEAERIGPVLLVAGGVYLHQRAMTSLDGGGDLYRNSLNDWGSHHPWFLCAFLSGVMEKQKSDNKII